MKNYLSESLLQHLCCPVCKSNLVKQHDQLCCGNSSCRSDYPFVAGTPILINESNSLFQISDFQSQKETTLDLQQRSRLKRFITSFVPSITKNIYGEANYKKLHQLLRKRPDSKVLIIGCGFMGEGVKDLIADPAIDVVESDVALGPRTNLICDAHDIPFKDASFDAVIIQAVLEHVLDPYRCVEEIHRVLKDGGLVYAETPFMQQVHMREYDFTRFTYLGHRRLFRKFEEIDAGPVVGPGSALAWAYQYFMLSFTSNKKLRKFIIAFAGFTSFYLKYFDRWLVTKPASFDAASGFYFMGSKATQVLSDRELIKLYKGGM